MVVHPSPARTLPRDNPVTLHDVRGGADRSYNSIHFGEEGHALAVTVAAEKPTSRPWKHADSDDRDHYDEFLRNVNNMHRVPDDEAHNSNCNTLVVRTQRPHHCVHRHGPDPIVSVPIAKRPLL